MSSLNSLFGEGWKCGKCSASNLSMALKCYACKADKPTAAEPVAATDSITSLFTPTRPTKPLDKFLTTKFTFGQPTNVKTTDPVTQPFYTTPTVQPLPFQQTLVQQSLPVQQTLVQQSLPVQQTLVQSLPQPVQPEPQLIAINTNPLNKKTKTMGMLICSVIALDGIESMADVAEPVSLFEKVIKGQTPTTGRLTTIAPLAMLMIPRRRLETIVGTDTDIADTCAVYLNLLRRLINETLITKEDIINYVLTESQKNKRFFFTIRVVAVNPDAFFTSIERTEIDVVNAFCAALSFFVRFEGQPFAAMMAAKCCSYFPDDVVKVVGGMVGASYGYDWIPSHWSTIPTYQTMLDLTTFFGTIGNPKPV